MKLTDLINGAGGLVREAANFIRYPIQIVSQQFRRVAQEKFEQIEVPFSQRDRAQPEAIQQTYEPTVVRSPITEVSEAAPYHSPRTSKLSELERVPSLESQKISGRRGRYQVERLLQENGFVRFYQGFWIASNLPIVVKEYCLSDWSDRAITQAKDAIERIETVSLKSGGVQDFRLITPWDAWVSVDEKRGYLILRDLPENSTTLRQHLQFAGAMSPTQVRRVLAQILQTLWFLHSHKIRFADGTVQQGIVHGNLNLDSLLIMLGNQPKINEFQIYTSDLELWEAPFQRSKTVSITQVATSEQVERDLYDLGVVGFYLLVGEVHDRCSNQAIDLQGHYNWAAISDVPLKQFIWQLLNVDHDRALLNAEEASKALRNLPDSSIEPEFFESIVIQPQPEQGDSLPLFGLLFFAILLSLLVWVGLSLLNQSRLPLLILGQPTKQPSTRIRDIEPIKVSSNRSLNYAVSDAWLTVTQQRISFDKTLQAELIDRASPAMAIQIKKIDSKSRSFDDALVKQLRTGEIEFFLSEQIQNLPNGLAQEAVASDGLVVVVAFADSPESIPQKLQGKVSLDQLRRIYTGEDPDYQVVYAPESASAVEKFQRVVFAQSPQEGQQFEKDLNLKIKVLPSGQMFRQMFQAFQDNQAIGVGFDRLSNVFGQCSVYPLALVKDSEEFQTLVQDNGAPISPQSDLCIKGSYRLKTEAFERYPLSYRLSIVYAKSNDQAARDMIRLLTSDEAQCLLSEAGLVPIKPGWNKQVCDQSRE